MKQNLHRMQHAVNEWMILKGIKGDAEFQSIEDWLARGELYLNDSLSILLIDGSYLHTAMNFGGDFSEFDELVESFGFWYEMGYSWCLGFYPIASYDYSASRGTYSDKLQDHRWRKKASIVKANANHVCQDCGRSGPLDAHHCYYAGMSQGYEPWEYPLSALRALCRQCHQQRARTEIRMRSFMANLTHSQIESLREALDHAYSWYEIESVSKFLGSVGPEQKHLLEALNKLTRT